ncbi:hypothetical protein KIPB_005034 [Kipferlia bialata]|uniref:Uncharacterized protein n=1 Tax=Kipferlia bialata TaxID=797122 RepID=A0A9K3CWM5_9EUKA|nr:hypothetical protein KIPB_005034 [Kipferlia bialata]|eukprot:g5034.t1
MPEPVHDILSVVDFTNELYATGFVLDYCGEGDSGETADTTTPLGLVRASLSDSSTSQNVYAVLPSATATKHGTVMGPGVTLSLSVRRVRSAASKFSLPFYPITAPQTADGGRGAQRHKPGDLPLPPCSATRHNQSRVSAPSPREPGTGGGSHTHTRKGAGKKAASGYSLVPDPHPCTTRFRPLSQIVKNGDRPSDWLAVHCATVLSRGLLSAMDLSHLVGAGTAWIVNGPGLPPTSIQGARDLYNRCVSTGAVLTHPREREREREAERQRELHQARRKRTIGGTLSHTQRQKEVPPGQTLPTGLEMVVTPGEGSSHTHNLHMRVWYVGWDARVAHVPAPITPLPLPDSMTQSLSPIAQMLLSGTCVSVRQTDAERQAEREAHTPETQTQRQDSSTGSYSSEGDSDSTPSVPLVEGVFLVEYLAPMYAACLSPSHTAKWLKGMQWIGKGTYTPGSYVLDTLMAREKERESRRRVATAAASSDTGSMCYGCMGGGYDLDLEGVCSGVMASPSQTEG